MRAAFQFTCNPPVARLRVHGDVDISTADQLSDVFDALSRRRCHHVEVNLDGVTFVDAYPLSRLREEQLRLREAGGDLVVVTASTWYTLVCRLAQYDTLLPARGIGPGACSEPSAKTVELVNEVVGRRGAGGL